MSKEILYLQNWYISKCNGEWEHNNGIVIENLDNPGWHINISGEEDKQRISKNLDISDNDWLVINATENSFDGASSSNNLEKLLKMAIAWLDNKN
ncbi:MULTISPECIES: Imm53 family immunity protein [unclassified Campylobacter]|uniref:Imm53 family immunity protein n=1 Tax=unclassified Campylobacter TaxID=2593542 RepID=UPI0022E9FEF1|nr:MULTISPECIES: Imm53 family immunity protein [unclassified Campylobacter]MDA3042603.1 immunity 53 family protein [Campylobacter sp. JMF_09 ED2]MDA3044583.1 immunity 53 family protein [Campylobacter sp. JMF_07 ED4]MDA3054643.1 immunity 53 family protein [Campylobacter sp. VBCF_07 NA4]MDA3063294.1 immunity 53 family protein [Campylobacter sp. JMF_11 EL3]MDA3070593.1 immunity 53 family protein [Campylobacter sp. VBCF_08 NA3]